MPYRTPAEILKTSRSIQTDLKGSFLYEGGIQRDEDLLKALLKEDKRKFESLEAVRLARQQEEEDEDSGLWDDIKGAAGTALGAVGDALSFGGAVVGAGATEISDLVRQGAANLPLPEDLKDQLTHGLYNTTNENVRQTGASFSDFMANVRNRVSPAEHMDTSPGSDPLIVQALRFGLGESLDPVNYLTAGTGRAAREGARTLARVAGDDVAQAVRRGGVRAGDDLLAGRAAEETAERLARFEAEQAAEVARRARFTPTPATPTSVDPSLLNMSGVGNQPSLFNMLDEPAATVIPPPPRPPVLPPEPIAPTTIRDILASQINPDLVADVDSIVNRRLATLDQRGGLGIAGFQSGIGQQAGERALDAVRSSTAGQALRNLFVPTARVADELGQGAATTTDIALHSGGVARRQARNELADTIADAAQLSDEVSQRGRSAMAEDLLEYGNESFVRTAPTEGWTELADGVYVPPVIADTLKAGFGKPSSEVLRAYDAAQGWLKSHLTLNPVLNPAHVPRNVFSNMLFAGLYGGVTDPKIWRESNHLRKRLIMAVKNGDEVSVDSLKKLGLNETQANRALAMHKEGLAGRGGELIDDVSEAAGHAKGPLGTRNTARVNQWHEEVSRGAVFLKALDDGLKPAEAAARSRHAMLDYSSEGLTQFERGVLQRLTLFYKFPRRAIPRGMEFIAQYPGPSLALSKAGLGADLGERNQYGSPIGGFLDTPLEATVGGITEVASHQEGPLVGLVDNMGAPWLTAALDVGSDARSVENLLPVLGSGERLFSGGVEGWVDKAIAPPGYRVGKDYERERAEDDLTESVRETVLEGKEVRGDDALKLFAEAEGIEDAVLLETPDLIDTLLDRGVPALTIGYIILGKPPEPEEPKVEAPTPDEVFGPLLN